MLSPCGTGCFRVDRTPIARGGKNQVVALIDAGSNVMNLTVLRNGQQVYAREQAFGGGQLTQDIAAITA
jgi:type IV pilus assembly protein PilM